MSSPHATHALLASVSALAVLILQSPAALAEEVERVDLARLTELARHDPRADMARYQTAAARARHDEARAARYPKVDIVAFVAPSPEIRCENADCTRTTPEDASLALAGVFGGARVSAVQPLYTFGKLDAITRAAAKAATATERLEDSVAGDLTFDAARAYYGLKLARELRWMLEDGLAEIDKALAGLEERIEEGSGEVTIQDKLRVETLRAEVIARLTEARQAENTALAAVHALAGRTDIDVDDEPLEAVEYGLGELASYLASADRQRPDLAAARVGAEAAEAKAEFERAHYWPDLVLYGTVDVARAQGADNPPSAFANDPFNKTSAGVALGLRWSLDPMTQRARTAQARADAARARALAELAATAATYDVRSAYGEAEAARARVDATRDGERSARGWVASVLQADAVGAAEAKDLADAFIAYFTLRARYVTSVYEWNIATVRLRRAAGEFTTAERRPKEST